MGWELLSGLFIGALLGGAATWFVQQHGSKGRLEQLQASWTQLHRRTETQRDDLQAKFRESAEQLARAERELRETLDKHEQAVREIHEGKVESQRLEAVVQEREQTIQSQKAVIGLMKAAVAELRPLEEENRMLKDRLRPSVVARVSPPSPQGPDDLKMIRGIGPTYESMLHELGITTFRQIALWSDKEIEGVASRLGISPKRIQSDDWVLGAKYRLMAKQGASD